MMYYDIINYCQEAIPEWNEIPILQFEVERITGTMSNIIYKCKCIEKDTFGLTKDPCSVIIRIYGKLIDNLIDREKEQKINKILGNIGCAPKIIYEFSNGRIESFISGRSLINGELQDKFISPKVAEIMAFMHSQTINIDNSPILESRLDKWFELSKNKTKFFELNEINEIKKEINWIKSEIKKFTPAITLCHNDLQKGNIILNFENDQIKLMMIDFEYSDYNYSSFDLANTLCESYIDYNSKGFSIISDDYPTLAFITFFVTHYLKALKGYKNDQELLQEEEIIKTINEIKFFMLCSHLLWVLWSIIQATANNYQYVNDNNKNNNKDSNEDNNNKDNNNEDNNNDDNCNEFPYIEYGKRRLQEFYKHKFEYQKISMNKLSC